MNVHIMEDYNLKGLLGWYMVKSGLEDQDNSSITPRVSPYRLSAHLASAFLIYSLLFFQAINHIFPPHNVCAPWFLELFIFLIKNVELFIFKLYY